ncbi:hypothetical protein ACD591_09940 [Rufibacter glacialis]|uniref:Uncharacterized protein n=1 Tax=Rufibacter glacialis TaxID=1259555 RepID=A0A5M8Q7P9_9BACT|nr:hypothetical protein [Rufibacter glacialis]KAA6431909.1 hypothetical protein FOE74_17530 [Rufibacter glacialis]
MKTIEKYLTDEELELIPSLLGEQVYMIYSPGLHVDANLNMIEANSLSLSSKMGFFNFYTSWIDSDEFDYYEMTLSRTDDPFGITRNQEGLLMATSWISITPASAIRKIELFEDSDEFEYADPESELASVRYDSAFLFTQKDGNEFLIGVSETIADLTLFLRDGQSIREHLRGKGIRRQWK